MKKILVMVLTLIFTSSLMAQTNLALSGTATASSDAWGWVPAFGIDNNINTGYHSAETAGFHWYEVDLGKACQINTVEIVNRAGFLDRLNGAIVKLLDANRNVLYTSEPVAGSPVKAVFDTAAVQSKNIRFVRVEKDSDAGNPLTIMELRAFDAETAAVNVAPADKVRGVLVDKNATGELSPTLQWAPSGNIDSGTVTGYFVFFDQDQIAVTQAAQGDAVMLGSSYITGTSYQHTANLEKDKTYYWRVDTRLQNDPNSIVGKVWSFDTELTVPQISAGPVARTALVGSDVEFSITAFDPLGNGLDYQWYFDPNLNVIGDEQAIGINSNILTINQINNADAGYYYCVVTNDNASITSSQAQLRVGNMVAHWPFDGNVNEVITGTVCTAYGNPSFVEGKVGPNALVLDGIGDYVSVPEAALAGMAKDQFTISLWFAGDSDAVGHNNVFGFYDADYKRIIGSHFPHDSGVYFDAGNSAGFNRISGPVMSWAKDTQWHNAVFVKNSNTGVMRLYIDGVLWISGTGRTRVLGDAVNIVLGADFAEDGSGVMGYYKGKLDDIRIYDIAIDAYDVAQLYFDVTGQAQCLNPPMADLNNDCVVDLQDFAIIANSWLACNRIPASACDN